MRKAYINAILLGGVLLSGIIVLIATLSDEIVVKNKIVELKEITDNSVLAMVKHYAIEGDTTLAEGISDGLLEQSKLGQEVTSNIVYTWDLVSSPKTVTATIANYTQGTFWYKFLDKDNFQINNIESKANLLDPLGKGTPALTPLAINNCIDNGDGTTSTRPDSFFELPGTEFDLVFTTHEFYNDTHNETVYAVDPFCNYPTGNSKFAHFKNLFSGGEVEAQEYDIDMAGESDADELYQPCLIQTDFQNAITVDPNQFNNVLKSFTLPYKMDVLLAECDSEVVGLDVQNVLSLELTAISYDKNTTIESAGVDADGNPIEGNKLTLTFKQVPATTDTVLEY